MDANTAQRYARCIGVLYVISILTGAIGESIIPQKLLLANDLAATAHKVATSIPLFRASFACYLIEATCDITLNIFLYALLRPINRTLALLAAAFGLMGTAVFAAGEILYFAAALPALDADVARVISPDTQAALTYLCLTIYGYGFGIFATFYGSAAAIRGYLVLRSTYLPRWLGAILILGGVSFIAENFLLVLAPKYNLPYVIFPMFLAMASMALWLLIKGIDRTRWTARVPSTTAD